MDCKWLLQGTVAAVCVTCPVWGSVALLAAVQSAYPDYPLWLPPPVSTPVPTPLPAPGPHSAGHSDGGQDRGREKELERQLAEEEGELSAARAKLHEAESELKRALAGSSDADELRRQLLEERRRRQAAEAAAAQAGGSVEQLRKELERAQAQAEARSASPVLEWLQGWEQHLLAALLGLLGVASLLGPRQFVWAFCPVAGSLAGGLLVAASVAFYVSPGSSAEMQGGGPSWAGSAAALAGGLAGYPELLVWWLATAAGLLRWLFQWNCYYYADVDLDGPFEDGPLEEPLLKFSQTATDTCDAPIRGLQGCDEQLRGMASCAPLEGGSLRGMVSRLTESLPSMHKQVIDEDEPASHPPPPAASALFGEEGEPGALERRPSRSQSQTSGQGSRQPGRQPSHSGTPSEVSGSQGIFEQMDADHDGVISRAEFQAARRQAGVGQEWDDGIPGASQERLRTSSDASRNRPPPIQGMPTSNFQPPRQPEGGYQPAPVAAPAALRPPSHGEGSGTPRDEV